jgi:hypothetical protein
MFLYENASNTLPEKQPLAPFLSRILERKLYVWSTAALQVDQVQKSCATPSLMGTA